MESIGGFTSNNGFRKLNYVLMWNCSQIEDLSWLVYAPILENLLIENFSSLEEIITLVRG